MPTDQTLLHFILELAMITELMLSQGRSLILLDGLDEVREEDSNYILSDVNNFSLKYHSNQFIVTCRIASYIYTFEQFVEVEIADFDFQGISQFAQNWFRHADPKKAESFIQVLEENQPIQELATNPLLLTMLCLVFEEGVRFPSNRSELYQEGVDILLKKWDAKRNIQRDEIYKQLSVKRKEELLSQIAFATFEKSEYFFTKREIVAEIKSYIELLPGISADPEAVQVDSEGILHSIEAQHGFLVERARNIYSFSHITFHEYFAARKIASSADSETTLEGIAVRITEKRWREVFLLTVGMLNNADQLLLIVKRQIDSLVTTDAQFQKLFSWIDKKARSINLTSKLAAARTFYFALTLAPAANFTFETDSIFTLTRILIRSSKLESDFELDLVLSRYLACVLELNNTFDNASALSLGCKLEHIFTYELDLLLSKKLQNLREQLPDLNNENVEAFKYWWQLSGHSWTDKLRSALIEYRNIGHNWQFNSEQLELLRNYYDANQFLIDCLNSDCYVSREVREKIEDELLVQTTQSNKPLAADSERS